MITMKTGSKTPVRFIFTDGISETTVTISPDEPSEDIAAKMRRVLELERPHEAARLMVTGAIGPDVLRPAAEPPEFGPLFDAAGAEQAVTAQPVGWERVVAEGDEDLPIAD